MSIARETGTRQVGPPQRIGSEPVVDVDVDQGLTIDCERCVARQSDACRDCVVTFLLEREPDDAVVIDAEEARAMRMLGRAGLVPELRFATPTG
jgi:hypothetical protein